MIRILVIDDSRVDRMFFNALLSEDHTSWMRGVELDMRDRPLENIEEYQTYDGIVLDMHLSQNVSGLELARMIHRVDWRTPIMLMTGALPEQIPLDAWDFIDYISFKQVMTHRVTDLLGNMRCMMRQIGRIRAARAGHTLEVMTRPPIYAEGE